MEAARKVFEELLRAIATTDVPHSRRIARAIANVPPSGLIARAIPLYLATQLRDAGTRLREQQLGNASVRELVQPLGTQIETLGTALVEVVSTPLAEAQNPLPNLRDDLLVAKRNLHRVWGARIRIRREG